MSKRKGSDLTIKAAFAKQRQRLRIRQVSSSDTDDTDEDSSMSDSDAASRSKEGTSWTVPTNTSEDEGDSDDAHVSGAASDTQADMYGRYIRRQDLGEDAAHLLFRKFRAEVGDGSQFERAPKGFGISEAHLQGPYTDRERI